MKEIIEILLYCVTAIVLVKIFISLGDEDK
jgi:hypothetical protein